MVWSASSTSGKGWEVYLWWLPLLLAKVDESYFRLLNNFFNFSYLLTRLTNTTSLTTAFKGLSLQAAWVLQLKVFVVLTKVLPTSGQLQLEMDCGEGKGIPGPWLSFLTSAKKPKTLTQMSLHGVLLAFTPLRFHQNNLLIPSAHRNTKTKPKQLWVELLVRPRPQRRVLKTGPQDVSEGWTKRFFY